MNTFPKIAQTDPESGVGFCPGDEYFEDPSRGYTDLNPERRYCDWPGFYVSQHTELPLSARWGIRHDACLVDIPRYLPWLRAQLGDDTVVVRGRVEEPRDGTWSVYNKTGDDGSPVIVIVNATGTGMNNLPSFISRGQFIHISNPYQHTASYHSVDGLSIFMAGTWGHLDSRIKRTARLQRPTP